jgi:hypothetical protein
VQKAAAKDDGRTASSFASVIFESSLNRRRCLETRHANEPCPPLSSPNRSRTLLSSPRRRRYRLHDFRLHPGCSSQAWDGADFCSIQAALAVALQGFSAGGPADAALLILKTLEAMRCRFFCQKALDARRALSFLAVVDGVIVRLETRSAVRMREDLRWLPRTRCALK